MLTEYLREQCGDDDELFEKMLPGYPPFSKRFVRDTGIWPNTFKRDHVALETKGEDFLGREALTGRKEDPQRVLVGLELDGNEPVVRGATVFHGSDPVGVITSATRSPVLEKTVALCRMGASHGAPGTELEVVDGEAVEAGEDDDKRERRPARVVALPFYDPGK
jgi:aminomethyltransferase